jgi:hypothetical protein
MVRVDRWMQSEVNASVKTAARESAASTHEAPSGRPWIGNRGDGATSGKVSTAPAPLLATTTDHLSRIGNSVLAERMVRGNTSNIAGNRMVHRCRLHSSAVIPRDLGTVGPINHSLTSNDALHIRHASRCSRPRRSSVQLRTAGHASTTAATASESGSSHRACRRRSYASTGTGTGTATPAARSPARSTGRPGQTRPSASG